MKSQVNRQKQKYAPFVHKWTISALWITIKNPVATLMRTSINLVTKQIYNPGYVIKYNPWCTYSPLVPKWDTFMLLMVHLCMGLSSYYYLAKVQKIACVEQKHHVKTLSFV